MTHLKLISLHIHKTAGTSFYKSLEDAYGANQIAKLNITPNSNTIFLNDYQVNQVKLPTNISVVHGHFTLKNLYIQIPEAQNIPHITWFRNPIERVVSNYTFMVNKLNQFLTPYDNAPIILEKMMRSLEEYIVTDINRNVMSKMLSGRNLADFNFIGIVEHYEQDMHLLSAILNKSLNVFHENITQTKKQELSNQLKDLIIKNNLEDIALYDEALSIRNKRIS